MELLARSLAAEDPCKNIFSVQTGRRNGAFLKQPIRLLYPLLQCFFCLSSVKNYFSIVAFHKTPVSLEHFNHFSVGYPLTPLRHFENFSLTVFLKKLKKEQFDSSYFYDSRYIYIYIYIYMVAGDLRYLYIRSHIQYCLSQNLF